MTTETQNGERLARALSVKPITIPHIRRATIGMLAEQYKIPYETFGRRYREHKDEFVSDAVLIEPLDQFESMLAPTVQFVTEKKVGVTNYMFANAAYASITPGRTLLFNETGIDRLIRYACCPGKRGRKPGVKYDKPKDVVAAENVLASTVDIPKSISKTEFDSSEEEALLVNMAKAYKTGEIMNLLSAALALDTYRQHTIKELKANQTNNYIPWASKASINRVVNTLSDITGERKCRIWDVVIDRLINRYNVPLKDRNKKPLIDGLKDEERHLFYQVFVDICADKYLDVNRVLMKAGVNSEGLSVMVKY